MKPFNTLGTIEIAKLTQEQIAMYSKELGESRVLQEVSECRKRLDGMGIDY